MRSLQASRRLSAGLLLALCLTGAALAGPGQAPTTATLPIGAEWCSEDRGSKVTDEGCPGIAVRAGFYLTNRLCDFLDLFSLNLAFGFGLDANAHATRFLQAGLGGSTSSRLGFVQRRFGLFNETLAEAALLPLSVEYWRRSNAAGIFRNYQGAESLPLKYQRHRDYWGVGGHAFAAILGVQAEMHPLELPDLLLGFGGIDYRHDDLPGAWTGNRVPRLPAADRRKVKRILVVPSRVVAEPSGRMERESGVGVYFERCGLEYYLGRFGTVLAASADEAKAKEFSRLIEGAGFDLHRTLMDQAGEILAQQLAWEVVVLPERDVLYAQQAVRKTYKGQTVRRLPNYRGMARQYDADAVLDVRVWEWGVWRESLAPRAGLRLDCEFKIIGYPEARVLFDARCLSFDPTRRGVDIGAFGADQGALLLRESRAAADAVAARLRDRITETN